MSINNHLMIALEPIFDAIKSLSNAIDKVSLTPGEKGIDGKDGVNGIDGVSPDAMEVAQNLTLDKEFIKSVTPDIHPSEVAKQLVDQYLPVIKGADGAGIDSKVYIKGEIYREGSVVVANIGQRFRAVKDTIEVPSESEDWIRIGNDGFKHRGVYNQDVNYINGDIFTKDFGSFVIVDGDPVLLAGRGAKGERGAVGPSGISGKDGKDGSNIIAAETKGFVAMITLQAADGKLDTITLDFTEAFNEAIKGVLYEI